MRQQHLLFILLFPVWLAGPSVFAQTNAHTSANQRNSFYAKVQNDQQNFSDFSGFMYLFQKKASIPKDLVLKFAPTTPTKGSFQALSILKLPNGVTVMVLEQKSSMCVRQHILTSDGNKVINQLLVGERCTPAPGAHSNEYSALEYEEDKGFLQVIYKDVYLPEKDREVLSRQLLKITSQGNIVPVPL